MLKMTLLVLLYTCFICWTDSSVHQPAGLVLDPTCAGGAEGVTTGAWTEGAAEEVIRSPDKKSRASPGAKVGCRRKNKNIKYQYPAVIICWDHNDGFSPLKWMCPSSHLRFGSRQFFEFLLIKPVVWMNCIVPLSYKNTLLLLVFTLLKRNKKVSVKSWSKNATEAQGFLQSEAVNSVVVCAPTETMSSGLTLGSSGLGVSAANESPRALRASRGMFPWGERQEVVLYWSVIIQTLE